MILPAYVAEMASYNQWQNQVLYRICDEIGPDQRSADRGMFFGSIDATLDHILLVDRLILAYVKDGIPPDMNLRRQFDEFAAMRAVREAFDLELCEWAGSLTPKWLAEKISLGGGRSLPRGLLVTQMFNHQTHHRSQVTTHLHLMGIEYGSTDIPYNPHRAY